jgi:hypothetical protein
MHAQFICTTICGHVLIVDCRVYLVVEPEVTSHWIGRNLQTGGSKTSGGGEDQESGGLALL